MHRRHRTILFLSLLPFSQDSSCGKQLANEHVLPGPSANTLTSNLVNLSCWLSPSLNPLLCSSTQSLNFFSFLPLPLVLRRPGSLPGERKFFL